LGRRSNYIEDPKIAKEKQLKDTSTKEVTNQGSENVFSKSRGNSPRYMHNEDLHFSMVCITWNPHSLLDHFEHKHVQENINEK